MTCFTSLDVKFALLLAGVMFLATSAQLSVCMYKFLNVHRLSYIARDGSAVLLLTLLSSYLTSTLSPKFHAELRLPWIAVVIIACTVFIYASLQIINEKRINGSRLSPASVKQAFDDLNSGICFADASGKIVLINHAMLSLANSLTGGYFRTVSQLKEALLQPTVARNSDYPDLYRLPDGRVWRFKALSLTDSGFDGYTQITAQDVTELFIANESLARENEALKQTNRHLNEMYERLADRIREEETLNLKMKIHNDIGTSLIEITDILNGKAGGDMASRIERLEDAVSYFSDNRQSEVQSFDGVVLSAAAMNVELKLIGRLPEQQELYSIIVKAAQECVTNCKKHAGGKTVKVAIGYDNSVCRAVFTNDGKAPDGGITEGGGLSSLRRAVEHIGGEMSVYCNPEFRLEIKLSVKEQSNDKYRNS